MKMPFYQKVCSFIFLSFVFLSCSNEEKIKHPTEEEKQKIVSTKKYHLYFLEIFKCPEAHAVMLYYCNTNVYITLL